MLKVKIFSVYLTIYLLCVIGVFAQEENSGANPARQKGSPSAKYKIEVFNDYQCPSCASFNQKLKQIESRYANKILIIFRNYPLLNTHKNAMSAVRAVEAAGKQGKFWEMLEIVYQNQNEWNHKNSAEKIFTKYAKKNSP